MPVAHAVSRQRALRLRMRLVQVWRWTAVAVRLLLGPFSGASLSALSGALQHTRAHRDAVQYMLSDSRVAELCRQRYTGVPCIPGALLRYPPGSLGHEVAAAVLAPSYNGEFMREPVDAEAAYATDESYLRFRLHQMHELMHVLTGFSMDEVAGALGLQAFQAAQTRRPFSIALVGLGLWRVLARPAELPRTLSQIAKGLVLGYAAQPLLGQRFEDDWAKPVEQWRRELGLVHERSFDLRAAASALRPAAAASSTPRASSRPKR